MALTDEGIVSVPGMLSRWVRLPNGARAHYMTSGESGPAVILLHGGAAGSSGSAGWRFMAPFLGANGFRVYCPDQPGFGLADPRPEYWAIHGSLSHVEFVNDFANALLIERFHLAGNSMGMINTSHYVVEHPDRVLSYILIAGNLGDLVPADLRVGERVNINTFDGTTESMRRLMELIINRRDLITDDLLEMRTRSANMQRDSYQAFITTNLNDYGLAQKFSMKHRWPKVKVPGIYLYGMQDVLSPVENGYHQEDACPNIQFFYPDPCGHQGQTDQPEIFNQVFLEFFRDGRVSRATADAAGVSKRRPELAQFVEQAEGAEREESPARV